MIGTKIQVVGFGIEPIKRILFDWIREAGHEPCKYFVSTILDVHQLASWVLEGHRSTLDSTSFKNLCYISHLDNNFLNTKQTTDNLVKLCEGYQNFIKEL